MDSHRWRILLLIGCLTVLIVAVSVKTETTFRCGDNMVSRRDAKYQVLKRCGKPAYEDVRYEKRVKQDPYRDIFPPPGAR